MISSDCVTIEDNLPPQKIQLMYLLGGFSCSNCGYDDDWRALEIDHKMGRDHGGVEPIRNIAYWLENPNFAYDELQVLCANCHRIKTWHDRKGMQT